MSIVGTVRIGISGWTYAPWRGNFYPPGLLQADELSYASRQVDTIEINGTFYALQRPDSFARWYDETPEGFVFAVKGPRFITHIRRLREIETPLANFFASGVLRLEEKLGPLLWQFPPSFRFSAERLDHFLSLLPSDTEAAAALAEHRSEWLAERAWARTAASARAAARDRDPPSELPRPGLRGTACAGTGWRSVFADSVAWPYAEDVTTDFVYLRLHGSEELYASGYSDEALDHWAARIKLWARGARTQRRPPDRTRCRAGAGEPLAMSMSISTTTPRSARRSTPARCVRDWPEIPCQQGKIRIRSPIFGQRSFIINMLQIRPGLRGRENRFLAEGVAGKRQGKC